MWTFSVEKMDPLLSIENRLEELECKLGYHPDSSVTKTATELIAEVKNSLDQTVTAKDSINAISKRLDELNSYLDPQYVNQINDSKLKIHYLLSNESFLKHYCNSMLQCQEKAGVLDSRDIANIPKITKDLEKIKDEMLDIKYQCDQVDQCVMQAMEMYNNVFLSIMEQLSETSKRIDNLEKASGK